MITDAVFITVYAGLVAVVIATVVSFAINGLHHKLSKSYYWVSACVIGWLATDIAFHLTQNPQMMEYFDNLAFPFIAFLPVFLLQLTIRFYSEGRPSRERGYILLSIVPAITSLVSVVPSLNWLMKTNYRVVQLYPLHLCSYTWNVWFYIHASYCNALVVACCITVVWQYNKKPREFRLPSALLITGIDVAYLSNLPAIRKPDEMLDITVIGVCLSMVALYFAVARNPAVSLVATARKALYNNMEMPVFIMNRQAYILEVNRAAQELLQTLGACHQDVCTMVYEDVSDAIARFGGTVKTGFAQDDQSHVFLHLNGKNVVYKQVNRELKDKRGKLLGSYVVLIDITSLRKTVDELQWKAEVDVLTGIPNRRAFEQKLRELDTPDSLPLSFVVGDVNRLKQVNDEMGHRQGDMLLKTVAAILAAACPEGGIAARIGGDEFILVLPNCSEEGAQAIMQRIREGQQGRQGQLMGASIALGSITKSRPEEDAYELIHQADQRMYTQKQYDRRGRAAGR